MLIAVRKSAAAKLELIAEVAGLAVSFSGATLAAVFGKLIIAVILGAITLGFFLRLTGRRSNLQVAAQPVPGAYFSPSWTAFQADRGRDFSVIVDGISG